MADVLTAEIPDSACPTRSASQATRHPASGCRPAASRPHFRTGDMIKSRMPDLVKGAGWPPRGGNPPLSDLADITTRAAQATVDLRTETWRGFHARADVVSKGFHSDFLNRFGYLRTALSTPSMASRSISSSASSPA